MGQLDGKAAIVTGGGSGIGRAAARLFAREGARVTVADVRGEAAEDVADEITTAGGEAVGVQADVAAAADARRIVEATIGEFGTVDVLYNNAGVFSASDLLGESEDAWDRCHAINVKGTFLCTQAAVPAMIDAGGGAVVNQASVAALVGVPRLAAYTAAKGAIVALTRSMAVEFSPHGVRANCICPGTVETAMTEGMLRERGGGDVEAGRTATVAKYPLGRLGRPEDIAAVACFLASDAAGFVTGGIYTADGGMTAQ